MKQALIATVGLPASGKSFFAEKVVKKFDLNWIRNDAIRNFLFEAYKYYEGTDQSYHNEQTKSANRILHPLKDIVIHELLSQGQSVLSDSCNRFKRGRSRLVKLAKDHKAQFIILNIATPIDMTKERLTERDKTTKGSWAKTFENVWLPEFEEPTEDKADHLLTVTPETHDEVLKKLGDILT